MGGLGLGCTLKLFHRAAGGQPSARATIQDETGIDKHIRKAAPRDALLSEYLRQQDPRTGEQMEATERGPNLARRVAVIRKLHQLRAEGRTRSQDLPHQTRFKVMGVHRQSRGNPEHKEQLSDWEDPQALKEKPPHFFK